MDVPAENRTACLALTANGVNYRSRKDFASAEKAFGLAVLVASRALPEEEARLIQRLAGLNYCIVRRAQNRVQEAQELRETVAQLERDNPGDSKSPLFGMMDYQHLTAEALNELREFQEALPFWEACVEHLDDLPSTAAAGDVLWKTGACYLRIGLRDHAAVPLRAAVRVFRTLSGDPRFPAVLLDLGSALRKSGPVEAEQAY